MTNDLLRMAETDFYLVRVLVTEATKATETRDRCLARLAAQGVSFREISRVSGIPKDTVGRIVRRTNLAREGK